MELNELLEWLLAVVTLSAIAGATMETVIKPGLHRIRAVYLTNSVLNNYDDLYAAIVRGCALLVAFWEGYALVDVLDPWTNLFGVVDFRAVLLGVDLTVLAQLLPAAILSAFFGKQLHDVVSWLKGRVTPPVAVGGD